MRTGNSLGNRLIAFMLSFIMVLGMLPANVFALESTAEAKIGDVIYDTLAEAIAAVPTGTNQAAPAEATTITLLRDTAYAFDVGTSNGSTTMNLKLDLNGKTLTLAPSVGSVGTKSNGIRVLAYSKLEIVNGDLVCSSVAEDNVKVGIANYGTLTLTDVDVKKGDLTIYTINNRGALTLNGKTTVESGSTCAITNDPYDLYYTTDVNASVTCNSSEVVVDSMLVERYERTSNNNGGVELNISAGYFGKIVEDGESAVSTNYNVTGGTIGVSTTEELEFALNMVKAGAEYSCPQQPVTIQLKNSIAGSFDVGTSTGKAPKNIVLDLNRNTLTLKPGVGSFNTKSNGIRVLAYSKLEIQNGTIICSSEEADNIKIGIANYSDLTLDSVAVKSGDLTIYTINNRGKLTLKGTTSVENAKAPHGDYVDSAELIAITNDPYNLYYSTPINAEINCSDSNVVVGNIQLETYGSKGDIELNITNGSFGGVYAPAAEGTVTVKGAISGGTFGTDVREYCTEKYTSVLVDGKYVTQYVKDDQIDFTFADKEPEINFNDNAENKYSFVVQNPKGTVTYTIVSGSEYATINAGTGELTVIKPGVVTVKASDTGNDLYNPAEATYTLTINKDDQEITFATPVPEDQWIGAPFVNTVSGGNGTGEISYWLVDGENLVEEISGVAKIDKTTGELTFLCVGTQITVKAVKAADDYYDEVSATYTVTGTKKEPSEVAFATTGPITITYNPENLSFKNNVVGCSEDDIITWSIVSGDAAILDTATGALTINKAGTIVIRATVAESPYYFEKAIEYTLVIDPANQADLNTGNIPAQITYSPNIQEGLIVGAGGSGTGAYGYEIVEGNEFAEINAQTGAIKILKAGNFVGDEFVNGVIKVKITKAGDDCYNAAEPVYVTISLARADQSGFGIGDNKSATVTYNDNNNQYILNASGGQSTGDVSYDIYRFENFGNATVDNNGVISILSAGTVKIRIIKAGDDCYNEIADQFALTIEKDEQDYSLTQTGTISLTYGTVSYTNELIKGTYVSSTNKPVYTISQNNIGASVNAETGEVTFVDSESKIGKATITVTVAEDACYKEFTASYEIDVSYLTTNAVPTTDGETRNTSGWYTDKVVIKAPAGYTIAYDNKISTEWKDEIPFTEEGINTATIYLKNSNGYITDKITVADIKLDTGDPEEQSISINYDTPTWEKFLENITFGIYKSDTLLVKISAKDTNSGIASLTYNIGGEDVVVPFDGETSVSHSFTINAQHRNKVILKATDVAGREIEKNSKHTLILDTKIPELDAAYEYASGQHHEYNDILYTQGDVTIHFTIEETNFDLSNAPVVTVDDEEKAVNWTRVENTDEWKADLSLSGNGDYVVKVTFTDIATNEMVTYVQEIHIDDVAPVLDVTYDNNDARNENNYKADRTATIKVTEHNFEPAEVKLTVTAKDITGAAVDISSKAYADYAKNPANWTQTGDVWTLNTAGMEFDIDAIYSVKLEYTDLAENAATTYTTDFVIDKTVPANIQIKYSTPISDSWNKFLNTVTFGYYPYTEKVEVTLIADDITSGVDFFTWTYTKEANTSDKNKTDETKVINKEDITYSNNGKTATASFVIDAQARGYISVDVTDKAGNTNGKSDNTRINVVDTIAPTREVSYQPERVLDAATLLDVSTFVEGDNVILYYEKEAVVTFTINEANFYAEDVVIKVNGVEKAPTDWTQNGDVWTGTITISGDGDYVVTMTYTDRSTNEMVAYQSQKIAIDNTDPTIKVEYNNNDALNTNNYKADRTATITIVEHNFRADDVKVTVTARDVQGNPITVTDYAAYLSDRSSWTTTGDTHVAKITYSTDAIYTFDIEYTDLIGNSAEDFTKEEFVIDHVAPTNLKIEYSDSVVEKIIEAITFGFYKPEVIVTLTADDITAGVDYFDWTYTKEDGTSDKNAASNGARITAEDIVYSNNGLTATATFKIPANARGYVSATVTDRAGNNDSKVDDKHINVVDNIAPTISVKYEADNADTLVQFTDKDLVTVESFEKAAIAHYNGNVTAKIVINEANFFEGIEAQDGVIYNVGIKLTKTDDNGNETVYEYLPAGAVQKYAGATPKYITWTTSGDEHSFSINYTDNADYVLEIDYTDLSSNEAGITANDGNTATKAYKSKVVTVDKITPVVSVKYGNEKVIHTIDGRDYFDAEQTATITVEEHNFRADDFAASVIAKNILGDDVNVEDFKATLSDDSKWTKNGNTYTITIKYSVDANYTFDYEYKDLAQNAAAEYTEDLFTVDTTAPENLTVTYSTSVLDKVLESITFGYYNAEMTVTITAEDDTAGIYYFVYSYIKSEGVSDVNTELINDKIEDANSRIVHEGKKSTTSFTIPKLLLANDNQFNGTVKFTAFDRSENNTEKVDNQRIVVDNIAPTATITYNQPVQNANNISYYAGNIDAKIVINEANFYSEDVVVTVTRDGANHPVNVKWVDDSVDVHTGTFTLTADGDYIVTVEYKDRSNNQMTKYTSNRLTLDTKAPSVSVSNIKNNSANKDEKYGFTITATDINLDASSFKPVLTATVRKDDGSYETKTVSLGDMKTVEAGKTYTFTVDNLEEDAVYSLVCTLKDMSGNQYSKIVLSDNESYDEVRFSINRNGSTFAVDEDTDALVNQYYVYSVNEDVVIEEVNVDPVETYVVKLNGEKLTEGTDYTTTLSNKDGEWSKRTYIISKDLFESEGEYSIVVESTDKAETTAYSDVKNLNVSFVVDQTAPVLTISGLENGGRYQVEEQTVTIIPTDDGGRLYSIKVVVLNSDGEPLKDANGQDISVRFEMSGEDFLTYLTENGGKVTFTVPEGLENQVQIICNDYAVNADGETNEFNETFTKVTVSQSQWIIFYANKPLFYGTIAGVVLLAGGIVALIVFLKKKKAAKK